MALATDYDGTAAFGGRLAPATAEALRRLKASGRRAFLVTGRALDELRSVCSELDLFDRVVAENGAVLYRPASGEIETLAEPSPSRLVALLRARHVAPLSVGRSILATRVPHQVTVLEAIRSLGLGLEIVFNKGAVMVLPSGVNKASGLAAALAECGLSPLNVVAVGDAENDHAFIKACGCAVAVANAIPSLKAEADLTTVGDHGVGLAELIDRLSQGDLADLPLRRHGVALCQGADGAVPADPRRVYMLAGTSGSGKSTLAGGLLERLMQAGYQFCVVDPEGDYEHVEGALVIGEPNTPPSTARVIEALERPDRSVVVNLLGLPHDDRPGFFAALLPALLKLRGSSARPHWLVIDEAHHLLPPERPGGAGAFPSGFGGLLLITVHPESVARPVVAGVDTLIVAGRDPRRTSGAF
ncbi:MAG: HAD-IIB family hydrolase, partial [Rhodospirillaceae bacterium]|nr:HAD-IIB family hydrolase [Rhodospirillaceae bacterium]